jgi:Ca2+:H+ antiporter
MKKEDNRSGSGSGSGSGTRTGSEETTGELYTMSPTENSPLLQHNANTNGSASTTPANADRRRSTLASLFTKNYTPGEESDLLFVRWPARTFTITKITLLSNYVNILLIFVPLGIIAGAMSWDPTTVFVLNFFAIVPLAAVLSFATEEISMKLGETMGGLLNATFGNAVELIVRITLQIRDLRC